MIDVRLIEDVDGKREVNLGGFNELTRRQVERLICALMNALIWLDMTERQQQQEKK